MSLKLKYFSLVDVYASPEHFGFCKCVGGDTYVNLRPLLKGIYIVE